MATPSSAPLPRFTTFATAEALRRLYAAAPGPSAPPDEGAAWWGAWAFLSGHTDTVLDLDQDAIADAVTAGDPVLRHLMFNGSKKARLYGCDRAPEAGPWRWHLDDATGRRPADAACLASTGSDFPALHRRLHEGRRVVLQAGQPLPDDARHLATPTPGLIAVDPYGLAGPNAMRGMAELAALFAPDPAPARFPFLLVVSNKDTVPLHHASPAAARDALASALRRARPDVAWEVTVVVTPRANPYHNRRMFSRYGVTLNERSADALADPLRLKHGTTLDARSVVAPLERTGVIDMLRETQALVTGVPEVPRFSGVAGPLDHPLFSVLDAQE